ncbi:sperm flagellar protein 2-like [Ceratina calcarata]|uniref:Sperm flagellar protein 2-like n=1 Tax=Ceratina calcarata TaxID=156304 RepID=A0AAJ7WES6_9HYME|nr:sperm flagellar protein 2-like [Ceratina calcarata]
MEQSKELDQFAVKHRVRVKRRDDEPETEEEEEKVEKEVPGEDPEMAKMYVQWLKDRKKHAMTANALKTNMQKALLSELWERMAEKQDKVFDEAIARRVLDQSRYEKQIVTKLCEVREQKNIMAENQKVVEDITQEAREVEHRASYERAQDLIWKQEKDYEAECRRMCELRDRLLIEKVQKIQQKHYTSCQSAVSDLTSIAMNMGVHRRVNAGRVPLPLLSEWKTMFVKSRPIFDEVISSHDRNDQTAQDQTELMLKSDLSTKFDKIEMLRDALFEDYLETNQPWDHSLPLLGEDTREYLELGRVVLGYIVHRLLEGLYAYPLNRSQTLLLKVRYIVVVLGIDSKTVYESIKPLLEHSGIRAVRMEDAINYCLEAYKREMTDVEYIDLNVVAATTDALEELRADFAAKQEKCLKNAKLTRRSKLADETSITSDTATNKKSKGKEKKRSTMKPEAEQLTQDKEIQTPRNIPYDDVDPVLTDAAYIGKWAYEFLILSEPITNELSTKILIEYLKSLTNAKGWALIDYPSTYEQMSRLEVALTGTIPPPETKALAFDDITMEDVESLTPRIIFEDPSDPYASHRQSKILPDPITKRELTAIGQQFAKLFVRVKQQPKYFEIGGKTYEAVTEDTPSLDKFYATRKIAHILYYSTLDLATLKKLARLIIGDPLQRQSSTELFGEVLKTFEKNTKHGASLKPAVVRRLLTEEDAFELEQLDTDLDEGEMRQDLAMGDYEMEFEQLAKPGESHWEWIEFPLSSMIMTSLARIWENVENIYVEELKELILMKSVHASSVVPYTDFVTQNAQDFIKRPDNKQDLLHKFHMAFNAIDDNARNDADVKCELHRRVADFQSELWEICDERRRQAEEERKRYINDHWTVREAVILFNVYVGIVQVEIDRCSDTIHLLQDYYFGMMKKSFQEVTASKVILNKIDENGAEAVNGEDEESQTHADKATSQGRRRDRAKAKAGSPKLEVSPPPVAVGHSVLQKEIDEMLLDKNKALKSIEDSLLYKGILENVHYAKSIVESLYTTGNEVLKREQLAISKSKEHTIGSAESADSIELKIQSRGQDIILEWQYAFMYEIERVRLKLESIIGVAKLDVSFLLETLQRAFHGIYDGIVDRYWREMKSVNDMANVFCFAIEEGRLLDKEMLLDGDRFVIRSNVYVVPMEPEKGMSVKEVSSPLRFRINHLAHLMDIFKRVAPYASMCEQSLVYILQDLVSHGKEEGETMLLPCHWYQLRPKDISNLVGKLFGSVDTIDWREFLIYAMDLPIPNCCDILIARDRFRIQDPELKEVVSLAQYCWTPLWFLECNENYPYIQHLLGDEFQWNREDLFEEEFYHFNNEASEKLFMDRSSTSDVAACYSTPEETLRLILAKELLSRMYMVDQHTVNYTALLLAFCKEEDPKDGFAKALALALGNRVCTNFEEGERYVQELLDKKRAAREASRRDALERIKSIEIRKSDSFQIAKRIVIHLIYRVERKIDADNSSEQLGDSRVLTIFSEVTLPESVAEIESFSSGEFGHEEVSVASFFEQRAKDQEVVIYWLSIDIFLTVMAAALPWHTVPPNITGKDTSLREALTCVYQELRDADLNEESDMALAHRVLNHEFVLRVLNSVTKFMTRNMGAIVEEILQGKKNTKFG